MATRIIVMQLLRLRNGAAIQIKELIKLLRDMSVYDERASKIKMSKHIFSRSRARIRDDPPRKCIGSSPSILPPPHDLPPYVIFQSGIPLRRAISRTIMVKPSREGKALRLRSIKLNGLWPMARRRRWRITAIRATNSPSSDRR